MHNAVHSERAYLLSILVAEFVVSPDINLTQNDLVLGVQDVNSKERIYYKGKLRGLNA